MDYNSISVCDELHSGIYILQRNDHIGTNVFKIGRTDVGIFNRYTSGYDTGSKLYYYCPVKYSKSTESFILDNLRNNNLIKYRRDLGFEYFESDYKNILDSVNNLCNYLKIEHNHNIDELIQFCNDNHNKIIPIKYKSINDKVNNKSIINQGNTDNSEELSEINIDDLISNNSGSDENDFDYLFTCKRCGYETPRISNLKRHLNRDRQCSVLLEDISIETLLNELPSNS